MRRLVRGTIPPAGRRLRRPEQPLGDGSCESPFTFAQVRAMVPTELVQACRAANAANRIINGRADQCVVTSYALRQHLVDHGREANLVRVTTAVHFHDRLRTGVILGSDGCGGPRRKANEGMWLGHLAVTCGEFLADPTLDQVNRDGIELGPLVVPLPDRWDDWGSVYVANSDLMVSYNRFHRQVGFLRMPQYSWRPILTAMEALEPG
jgi:hypothetical protein